MKEIITLGFLLSASIAIAQDQRILEIRKLYNETQAALSDFNTVTIDDYENSSEGGKLTKFENKLGIKLIKTEYYGSIGKSLTEYYYRNGEVYFIFKTDYQYNAPPTVPEYDETKTEKAESRFYFDGTKLIRWITPDGQSQNLKLPISKESRNNQLELANKALQSFQ